MRKSEVQILWDSFLILKLFSKVRILVSKFSLDVALPRLIGPIFS